LIARKRAFRAGFKHRHHRNDANENAREEIGHFPDWLPFEAVCRAKRRLRYTKRSETDGHHDEFADQVLQFDPCSEQVEADAWTPEAACDDGEDRDADEPDIHMAAHAQFHDCRSGGRRFFFTPAKIRIDKIGYCRLRRCRRDAEMEAQAIQKARVHAAITEESATSMG
jgi:hypothetical protein